MVRFAGSFLLIAIAASAQDRGSALFRSQCAYCHGAGGEGGRGPSLNRPALRLAATDEILKRIITRGIPDAGMPGTSMSDGEAEQVAAYVRLLGRVRAAPVPGNAAAGEELYKQKGKCDACHMVRGSGGVFGPDLSTIGLRRSPTHLRASLIDPAADKPDGFIVLTATSPVPAKTQVTGVRINEDSFSVQIRDVSGKVHSFWKSDLASLGRDLKSSPMPSYKSTFTDRELDDLIAYLVSLRDEVSR
jgi:cytochrome c oxidase cbb3-type subunit III